MKREDKMSVTHSDLSQVLIVTGDVTMDWHIACPQLTNNRTGWTEDQGHTRAYWQRGGAALLADLLEAIAARLRQQSTIEVAIRQMAAPQAPVTPTDPRFHHAYKRWNYFPRTSKGSDAKPVWRMSEWLGLSKNNVQGTDDEWARIVDDTSTADLVILDDASLGFREHPRLWPLALQSDKARWIVLKMSRPVAKGALWDHLHEHHTDRLIVVTTIDDLRQSEVQISRELSWERTAQDLAWELVYNPRINTLSRCAHVIVSFGAAGVMLVSRQRTGTSQHTADTGQSLIQSRLFFDPKVIEGMWEQDHPGAMSGYTSCITVALAHQLMLAAEEPNLAQAMQNGLAALRTLHLGGNGIENGDVTFPIQRVVEQLLANATPMSVATVQDPGRRLATSEGRLQSATPTGLWTILEDRYVGGLDQVAQQIVLQGVEVALEGVPIGQFGALMTVDRQEIENFRSLRTLVSEYCRQTSPKRPLSIAVFGTPGSGKSFGVTQVATSLLPGQIEKLEFNLSQFAAAHQLLDAFHRVRDTALSGRIPLVFWDEFDSALDNQALGWLRHFLAPMQDGSFQEGQIVHPIGRAIFVFAGGTSESMKTFDKGAGDPAYRAAKGPDFVSRLKGYIDILGPNPKAGNLVRDRYYIIRRAILLRTLLQSNAPQLMRRQNGVNIPQIDSGLLRAFLEIPAYKHGARSMEALVTTSTLANMNRFERSSLPSETQLNLHVDGRQFLGLVQRLELEGDLLEKLAAAAHFIYQAGLQAQDKVTASLPTYSELSDELKEQNRQAVRDIPSKLAYAGYVMRPARSDEPPFDFPAGDREDLAELEHERWVKARIAAGWRYGSVTDLEQRLQADLLPWHILSSQERAQRYAPEEIGALGEGELPESEKEKNRNQIDGIPTMLAKAGYALIKVREHDDHQQ